MPVDTYTITGPCLCCCNCDTLNQFLTGGLSITFAGGVSGCPIDGQTYALSYVTSPPTDYYYNVGIPRCAHSTRGNGGWRYENAGPTITIWLPQDGQEVNSSTGSNTGVQAQCNKLYVHVRQSGVFPDCCAEATLTFDDCTDGAVSMSGTAVFALCTGNCSNTSYSFTITG